MRRRRGSCVLGLYEADIKQAQKKRIANAPQPLPQQRARSLTLPLPALPDKEKPSQSWNLLTKIKFNKLKGVLFTPAPQQTSDQFQSSLLSRLPLEIRQLIWAGVLGGNLLHICRARKKLLAVSCAENPEILELETAQHNCWVSLSCDSQGHPKLCDASGAYRSCQSQHLAKAANLLPLLQTCRRIYTEAISILYAGNIFDINHVDIVLYL
ncbi:uncharacterized protein BP5553_00228 [Venustampulla echinocandica]|uniref:DUF7730 domain-containing protein n=1 Tax=Venustampulla echinocandica TaxID=2656787 RepID=A0A370TXL3_9HELO|nr:uncharacterized protein BP5553_00228 [Venustampulla echinocandica]RDL40249.1 hypothetical protein BP5553_00228 [Venustampulla echinocandica]